MHVAVVVVSVASFFQFSKMRRNRSQRKVKQDLEKWKSRILSIAVLASNILPNQNTRSAPASARLVMRRYFMILVA